MVRAGRLAWLGVALALALWGCKKEQPGSGGATSPGRPGEVRSARQAANVAVMPSIHLRVYPDMAVPGKEVVVEVEVVPQPVEGPPAISFRAVEDPCNGTLETEGARAVYAVPPECRGNSITLETLARGEFGELTRTVTLDIKKTSFMEAVVFNYPVPGQQLSAPLPVYWDRTLYHNRQEKLFFRVERLGREILKTGALNAQNVVELDIPPSPEEVVLFGETSSGSKETALLRVYRRRVPEWPSNALMVDSFILPDTNSFDEPREVLDSGGEARVGTGYRIAADGRTPLLFMHYHVNKARRYGKDEAIMGITQKVPYRVTRNTHRRLVVWLRGDPVRGPASPVHVRLEGSKGSSKTFRIKRLRDTWRPYHFPLNRALRRGEDERLTRIAIFVDGRRVTPPLGTVLFGAMYLEPHPGRKGEEEE